MSAPIDPPIDAPAQEDAPAHGDDNMGEWVFVGGADYQHDAPYAEPTP